MKIKTFLTNDLRNSSIDLHNYICLITDILRTTTAITSMLASGAASIIISSSQGNAHMLKKYFKNYLLCGEHLAAKPKGFDYVLNSSGLSKLDLRGKNIILKTTNGTKSYIKAQDCRMVLTLSLLNLNYAVDLALRYANGLKADLLFLCSGILKDVAYDDAIAAGLAISNIRKKVEDIKLDDASLLVLNAALNENNIYDALKKSRSGRWTLDLNQKEELEFSSKLNIFNVTGQLEIDNSNKETGKLLVIKPV